VSNTRVGWRATAGSIDKRELIAFFQSALREEISELKKGKGGKQFEVYDGRRVYSTRDMTIYRFLTEGSLRDDTPVCISIGGEPINGHVVSTDLEGINIGLEVDRGEFVPQATIQSSSYKILEDLLLKLDRARSGEVSLNTDGSMKLFGFLKPGSLLNPVRFSEQITEGYAPNVEQRIAILKSLTQEVTFIWGPPGTGKTKTLSIILNQLIRSGRSVLLTSHTNAAVDEILKKFIENDENAPYIEAGRIIRYGIPTVLNDRFSELLVDTIIEKQTSKKRRRIGELQAIIGFNNEKIRKFENLEQAALTTNALLRTQKHKLEKVEKNTANLQHRILELNSERDEITARLTNQRELLEKAKTAGVFKRLFYGLNVERIETEMETMKTKQDILTLKLQSLKSELKDSEEEKNASLAKIAQLEDCLGKTVATSGMTSLESLQGKIHELSQEIEDKKLEIGEIETEINKIKENVFNNALVVGCTITRACLDSRIFRRKFDVLILDEASMAALPNLFFLGGLSSGHYIVSGDFRQLAPISASDSERVKTWLKRDIFVQSGIVESVNSNIDDERLVMLREQYRMHPDICALISDAVYGGKLRTAEKTRLAKEQIAVLPPFEDEALIFCDTAKVDPWIKRAGSSNSRLSPYCAAVSARLASTLVKEGKKKGLAINVGVVTPYSAQAQLISKILEDENVDRTRITASTVHRFQGNERECIVFDLVEGYPYAPGVLTKGQFTNSEPGRLITVAISRAEGKFILVGNSKYVRSRFNKDDAIFQIMDRIEKSGQIVDSRSILPLSFNIETPPAKTARMGRELSECALSVWNERSFYEVFRQDLENASSSVVIFSPFIARKRLNTLLNDFRSCVKKGTRIYVITRHPDYQGSYKAETQELIEQMREIGVKVLIASKEIGINEKFHDKIAIVDNVVFYHGSMNILSQTDSSESMIAFRTRKTVEELVKTFDVNRIIRKYQNIVGEHPSAVPLIKMVEKKLMEEMNPESCSECGERLVLVKGSQSFYFACPNMLDKGCNTKKEVDKEIVKKAISNMKIECRKCLKGHMTFREGKRGPFIGCDQYPISRCQSTLDFDDDFVG
jgi:superfamily I DNA and/or RNA helicase